VKFPLDDPGAEEPEIDEQEVLIFEGKADLGLASRKLRGMGVLTLSRLARVRGGILSI
jgi:hypothetical protein